MRAGRRGMALVTALVAAVILLSMGVGFLYFLERDYHFGGQQDRSQQAFYLALAGLSYQANRSDLFYPGCANVTLALPSNSLTHFVEIGVDSSGQITSRGYLLSPGFAITLAERRLTVAPGQPNRLYQDCSL